MGACTFFTDAAGATAQEAFDKAVSDAAWECGHGGYTGTIAEKQEFVVIPCPILSSISADAQRSVAMGYAQGLIESGDPRVDDKWGPAGCIQYSPGKFLFFGWASS
jgi:hypothetical protein